MQAGPWALIGQFRGLGTRRGSIYGPATWRGPADYALALPRALAWKSVSWGPRAHLPLPRRPDVLCSPSPRAHLHAGMLCRLQRKLPGSFFPGAPIFGSVATWGHCRWPVQGNPRSYPSPGRRTACLPSGEALTWNKAKTFDHERPCPELEPRRMSS